MYHYEGDIDLSLPQIIAIPAPTWVWCDDPSFGLMPMLAWYRWDDDGPYYPMTSVGLVKNFLLFWSLEDGLAWESEYRKKEAAG